MSWPPCFARNCRYSECIDTNVADSFSNDNAIKAHSFEIANATKSLMETNLKTLIRLYKEEGRRMNDATSFNRMTFGRITFGRKTFGRQTFWQKKKHSL
jgi:hypothetical protein